jgi:hypothetical protein
MRRDILNKIFNLSSVKSHISFPIDGFEDAEIQYSCIIFDNEVKGIIFLKSKSIANRFLITGYSLNNDKIIAVDKEFALKALNLLKDYDDNDLSTVGLSCKIINSASVNLEQVSILKDNELISIEENILIFIGVTKLSESIKIKIELSKKLQFTPDKFFFIGTKGSNDIISFYIKKNIEYEKEFSYLHLLTDATIYIDRGNGFSKEYLGKLIRLKVLNDKIIFEMSSGMYQMTKVSNNHIKAEKINPLNLVHFICRNAGLSENNINIEGHSNINEFNFIVINKLKNIVVLDEVGFGNCTILPPNTLDTQITDIEQYKQLFEENNNNYSYVKTCVSSKNFYDAFVSGKEEIEKTISSIMSIIRADSYLQSNTIFKEFENWYIDNLTPKPSVSNVFLIKNLFTQEQIIINNTKLVDPNYLVLDSELVAKVQGTQWLDELLINYLDTKNDDLQPLFMSLKWIRRSWDIDNYDDKVIYAIIALEFLAANEKVKPLISKADKKVVITAALDKFKDLYQGADIDYYHDELKKTLDFSLADVPLFAKIESLIKRLEIPISDNDISLLRKARKVRNDIVHGRNSNQLSNTEILLVNNIVSKITFYKLYSFWEVT